MTNTVRITNIQNSVVIAPNETRVVPAGAEFRVISPDESVSVLVDNPQISVLTVGIQGPEGVSEEETVYAKRVDFSVDGTSLYRAEAVVGSIESAAVWRIRRIVFSGVEGDVTETWADGASDFTKVWDDRATYTYS